MQHSSALVSLFLPEMWVILEFLSTINISHIYMLHIKINMYVLVNI